MALLRLDPDSVFRATARCRPQPQIEPWQGGSVHDEEDRWFSHEWPGRWWPVELDPGDAWAAPRHVALGEARRSDLARLPLPADARLEDLLLEHVCIDCNAVIVGDRTEARELRHRWVGDWLGGRWDWRPVPRIEWHEPADIGSELGVDHRHDDLIALAPGQVRFYESGGSGPFKVETIGTLVDVALGIRVLNAWLLPFPPLAVLNGALATGHDGDLEWPPGSAMSAEEYVELRQLRRWEAVGWVDVDVPEGVETEEQLSTWWQGQLGAFPAHVRQQFDRRVGRLLRGVHRLEGDEQSERWRAAAAVCRRMLEELAAMATAARAVLEVEVDFGDDSGTTRWAPPPDERGAEWVEVVGILRGALGPADVDGYVTDVMTDGRLSCSLVITDGRDPDGTALSAAHRLMTGSLGARTLVLNGRRL